MKSIRTYLLAVVCVCAIALPAFGAHAGHLGVKEKGAKGPSDLEGSRGKIQLEAKYFLFAFDLDDTQPVGGEHSVTGNSPLDLALRFWWKPWLALEAEMMTTLGFALDEAPYNINVLFGFLSGKIQAYLGLGVADILSARVRRDDLGNPLDTPEEPVGVTVQLLSGIDYRFFSMLGFGVRVQMDVGGFGDLLDIATSVTTRNLVIGIGLTIFLF